MAGFLLLVCAQYYLSLPNMYNQNATEIAQLLEDKAYRNTDYLIPPPTDADIISIETVISSIEELKTAWVRATVPLIPAQESLWHTVCGKCRRGVDGPVGSTTFCNSCLEDIEVEPRSRYGVYLYDGTITLEAIMYSPGIEKLVPFTPQQVFEAQEKGSPLNDEIEALLAKKEIYFFLKYFDSDFGGKLVKKFPILKVYLVATATDKEAIVETKLPRRQVCLMLQLVLTVAYSWSARMVHQM